MGKISLFHYSVYVLLSIVIIHTHRSNAAFASTGTQACGPTVFNRTTCPSGGTSNVADCIGYLTENAVPLSVILHSPIHQLYIISAFSYSWAPSVDAKIALTGVQGYIFSINNRLYVLSITLCSLLTYVPNTNQPVSGFPSIYGSDLYAAAKLIENPYSAYACNIFQTSAVAFIPTLVSEVGAQGAIGLAGAVSAGIQRTGTSASTLQTVVQNTCYSQVNSKTANSNTISITQPNAVALSCTESFTALPIDATQVIKATGRSIDYLVSQGGYGACAAATATAVKLAQISHPPFVFQDFVMIHAIGNVKQFTQLFGLSESSFFYTLMKINIAC